MTTGSIGLTLTRSTASGCVVQIQGAGTKNRPPTVYEAVANHGADDPHTILVLLHRHGPLLPPWVGLLVTSRPEQPASTAFDEIPMLRIDADTANNRADLRLYAQGWLGATCRSEQEVEGLIDAIDARADGSFIYLRKLRGGA